MQTPDSLRVTVAIPTYNPKLPILKQVIDALREQTLSKELWELIVVDSASRPALCVEQLDTDWAAHFVLLQESSPGLTRARLAAISRARGQLIVFVDDDNLLDPGYLEEVCKFAKLHPGVTAFGGKSIPAFAAPPADWLQEFQHMLALRDLGDEVILCEPFNPNTPRVYPPAAPIGAGMIVERATAQEFMREQLKPMAQAISDRTADRLSSGGDNDIVLYALNTGKQVGYAPKLCLQHLIPPERMSRSYLGRMNYASSRSWVQLLSKYDICPWKACSRLHSLLAKLRATLRHSPWKGPPEYIRWRGACGILDGRSDLQANRNHSLLRQLGVGKLIYNFYHRPRQLLSEMKKWGVAEYLLERKSQREMQRASLTLKPIDKLKSSETIVHFLTGRRYIDQTLFCAHSLELASKTTITPVLYDDGTLSSHDLQQFKARFPSAQIETVESIQLRLDRHLPSSQYPTLRARRLVYPHIRKLTDIHAGSSGWKLVLDSDMLFFDNPDEMLQWLQNPQTPLCMQDIVNSYGYSIALLEQLCQARLPNRVNVGVCGLNSAQIDWGQIENWCQTLLAVEGTQYTQEQALVAMMLADRPFQMLPAQSYIVLPSEEQVKSRAGALQHYVAESKHWYFTNGWQHFVNGRKEH